MESVDELRAYVRDAYLPPLVAALAHATGDLDLLREDLRVDPLHIREPNGGLSRDQRAAARELAVDVLSRLGSGSLVPAPVRDEETLHRIMSYLVGQEVGDDYLPLLLEELGVGDRDLRAPSWTKDAIDADRPFHVAVIGAGMSGLATAHRLDQAGIPFTVFEKNPEVGGTWFENRYPGCRVDVPNHLYSYSFAQRHDWPQRFSTRDALLDYFRTCASDLGIRGAIECGTEVCSATFRSDSGDWELLVRGPDGSRTVRADAVVSAVGQLNRPQLPPIEGRESFQGDAFHSAQWDDNVPLAGRRVAVIGTGASGFQLIPEIAETAASLLVFQRTPNWFMPTPDYHEPTAVGMQWLFAHVPFYSQWYRFWLFWMLAEGALAASRVDPSWEGDGRSISALNDMLRAMLTQYLEGQFADSPDLLAEVVPEYPPFAKRILLDNGIWAATLKRENVSLVTDPVARIAEDAIVMADGTVHPVDVIVYATGFEASRFLVPMKVSGRGGLDLHEHWDGDARAYLGITVPGFPNLFCLYGPNTNLVANGSIIFFSECAATYILGCVRLLLERHDRAMDCWSEVWERFNREVDAANRTMAWGASDVHSWYKNASGRVTQNWPFSLLEFWQRTHKPDPDDFEFL